MAETKAERWGRIHSEAMHQFDRIQSALLAERKQSLSDRRFYLIAGAQWEGPLWTQFENKPKIEVNKVHGAVMRVVNEYRANRIDVDFVPRDNAVDDRLAETCAGLYRADEDDSTATEAYDNAFEEGVAGGFGAFRLRAVWEDEEDPENDRQRIRIEPIYDADSSVYFDLDAKRYDKADATHAFCLTSMTIDAYRKQWGDDPSSWPKFVTSVVYDWCTATVVYVAEYYRVEETTELVRWFETIDGEEKRYTPADFERDPELEATLEATGAREVRARKVKRKRVRKYIMSGGKILEDQGFIPGNSIPLVPFYAKRAFIDNVERCIGIVRMAKDAQRLGNMQRSRLAETAALSPMEKPILLPEQVRGVEEMWRTDNVKNNAYLLIKKVQNSDGTTTPMGPVGYTKPPQVPPAMAALLQLTETDLRDVLGNPEGADKLVSGVSGKAIDAVSSRIDQQAYIYMSNFAKSIKRAGEVWLSMARDVYVEEGRVMKSMSETGAVSHVELQRPNLNEDGAMVIENDLANARFDVKVDVGPAAQSRRDKAQRELLNLLQFSKDPQTIAVLEYAVLMNTDGEGMGDLQKFFREKLVGMGVVPPNEKELQKMQQAASQQQPDPQALYLEAAAQEAQSRAVKAQADTELAVAKAAETRARTVEVLANVGASAQEQAIRTAQAIGAATAPPGEGAPTL